LDQKSEADIRRKTKVLEHAQHCGNASHTCRKFGVSRDTFYRWKRQFAAGGPQALVNSKPCPENPRLRVSAAIEERILYVRREFGLGQLRISWYLARYYGLTVSSSGVFSVLRRHGLSRLPRGAPKRSPSTFKRYEKEVPGHQVQIDVKFLFFNDASGRRIKRFQYTAIDDATRIRALRIYREHTQANAQDFLDYVIQKFPFRIKYVHTDNGHEFQSKFHWHARDHGIIHRYIRPASPHLNGKVERSHLTDHREFYQLLNYSGDRDLKRQLSEWESFYNLHRAHTALKGKTPYEILRKKMAA
jgi:transposase InsO family protein